MDEYIKKDTVLCALRKVREGYAGSGLIEGCNALLEGINVIKGIEADGVKPASYVAPLSNKERATVERALGIIEGATAAFRHDERYEGVEGMLLTAIDMIEGILNKGD